MAKVNWANDDEAVKAQIAYSEEVHKVCASAYDLCPNPLCTNGWQRSSWHGMEKANKDGTCKGSPFYE